MDCLKVQPETPSDLDTQGSLDTLKVKSFKSVFFWKDQIQNFFYPRTGTSAIYKFGIRLVNDNKTIYVNLLSKTINVSIL